jgi:hypothetical protein
MHEFQVLGLTFVKKGINDRRGQDGATCTMRDVLKGGTCRSLRSQVVTLSTPKRLLGRAVSLSF